MRQPASACPVLLELILRSASLEAADVTYLDRAVKCWQEILQSFTSIVPASSVAATGGTASSVDSAKDPTASSPATANSPAMGSSLACQQQECQQQECSQQADSWDSLLAWIIAKSPLDSDCGRFEPELLPLSLICQAANVAIRLRTLQSNFLRCVEASKRDSLYQLAYGLSHELNNPLANIASRAGILQQQLVEGAHRQWMASILENAMRGSEMLGDLMLIARPPQPNMKITDLSEFGKALEKNCRQWSDRRKVRLVLDWTAKGEYWLDATMLAEAVWCAFRNALEVSEEGQEILLVGRVVSLPPCPDQPPSVSLLPRIGELTRNDQLYCCAKPPSQSGPFLKIQLKDFGPGLSEQALKHCFDLYYSGRESGRGLGMGLAKARILIELLGGSVGLANGTAGGCVAEMNIPLHDNSVGQWSSSIRAS